jgi:hypothetical protein
MDFQQVQTCNTLQNVKHKEIRYNELVSSRLEKQWFQWPWIVERFTKRRSPFKRACKFHFRPCLSYSICCNSWYGIDITIISLTLKTQGLRKNKHSFVIPWKLENHFGYRFSAFWLRSKCSICSYQLNIWYGSHVLSRC